MLGSAAALVIKEYCKTNESIFTFLQKLSDEQLHWRLTPANQSIAFHAWHVARWTDFTQAAIPGMTPELGRRLPPGVQIWEDEGLAGRWGFVNAQLGFGDTGWTMPDEVALQLPFPVKAILLDYVGKAFAAVEHAVSVIDDEQFLSAEQLQPLTEGVWREGTVGNAILIHIVHSSTHLGNMGCLLGLQR